MPRYRIRFTGPVAPGIVEWFKRLIPVLRDAPPGVEVDVEVTRAEVPDADPDRPELPD